jgi:hypothetical protein
VFSWVPVFIGIFHKNHKLRCRWDLAISWNLWRLIIRQFIHYFLAVLYFVHQKFLFAEFFYIYLHTFKLKQTTRETKLKRRVMNGCTKDTDTTETYFTWQRWHRRYRQIMLMKIGSESKTDTNSYINDSCNIITKSRLVLGEGVHCFVVKAYLSIEYCDTRVASF